MKVSLESTTRIVDIVNDGVFQARVWQGTSEAGARVQLLVTRVGIHKDDDQSEAFKDLTPTSVEPEVPDVFPELLAIGAGEAFCTMVEKSAEKCGVAAYVLSTFDKVGQMQIVGWASVEAREANPYLERMVSSLAEAVADLVKQGLAQAAATFEAEEKGPVGHG